MTRNCLNAAWRNLRPHKGRSFIALFVFAAGRALRPRKPSPALSAAATPPGRLGEPLEE
jgi:hypothetical protein